jgi:hypothetical protein
VVVILVILIIIKILSITNMGPIYFQLPPVEQWFENEGCSKTSTHMLVEFAFPEATTDREGCV